MRSGEGIRLPRSIGIQAVPNTAGLSEDQRLDAIVKVARALRGFNESFHLQTFVEELERAIFFKIHGRRDGVLDRSIMR